MSDPGHESFADENRISRRFSALKAEGRAGLITFITAGDPDPARSQAILNALPASGADLIELGMPFTDPMADGPAIEAAGLRALAAGTTLKSILAMVRAFRAEDQETPLILMGYFNPIMAYGRAAFLADAKKAGVDGLIIVDLPPEEDQELCLPAVDAGVDFIRLATPTTDAARLPRVLKNARGFLYYVSVTGITGGQSAKTQAVAAAVDELRSATSLPIAVGFGITTPADAEAIARSADAVVVGSAIVRRIEAGLSSDMAALVKDVTGFVAALAGGVRRARPAVRNMAALRRDIPQENA
ncbi:MAG: tryptophan synthase subunit alpha [Pseudomonadota bacterium]